MAEILPRPPYASGMTRLLLVVLLGLGALTVGCGEATPTVPGAGTAAPAAATVNRYQVEGRVVSVSAPAGGLGRASIAHEKIPGFRDLETDEVVGMSAMTMPFPLAEGVEPPQQGQNVTFTLLVDGGDHGGLPYVIEAINPVEPPLPVQHPLEDR